MDTPADRIIRIRNISGTLELRSDVTALLNELDALPNLMTVPAHLREFAQRYTAAWCSQKPDNVASFYSPNGSLCVNYGVPLLDVMQSHA